MPLQNNMNTGEPQRISWELPLLIGLVLLGIMVAVRWWLWTPSDTRPQAQPAAYSGENASVVMAVLDSVLTVNRMTRSVVSRSETGTERWKAAVPADVPVPAAHLAIQTGLDSINAAVIRAKSDPLTNQLLLSVGWQDSCILEILLSPAAEVVFASKGSIALIIDDFGNKWGQREAAFTRLGIDLTVSVMPGAGQSVRVARELAKSGAEILLHMPMEPVGLTVSDNGFYIITGMTRTEIEARIERALTMVPGAVGMNNHMGSKATSDLETMDAVLRYLQQRGLCFIDSRTTAATVAYSRARALGVPGAERDIFLDSNNSPAAIREMVAALKKRALSRGRAVAIGHCRKNTLTVLQEEVPKLIAEGFTFVHVSHLLER